MKLGTSIIGWTLVGVLLVGIFNIPVSSGDLVQPEILNQQPVADAGSDQTVNVGETVSFDGSGSYDPDGGIVSYDWDFGDGTSHISKSSSLNVTDVQQITNAPYHECDPKWSPDGQKLAISAWTSQWYNDIIVMNSDGTGQQQLTSTTTLHERCPAYSPDSTKIVYMRGSVYTTPGNYNIYVMNVDGSGKVALTSNPAYDDRYPDWSPDCSMIYFASDRTGYYELWMMNSDGSNVVQLTSGMSIANYPLVSPDGKKIGFSTAQSGHYEAAVLDLQTNKIDILASDLSLNVFFSSWSPDGNRILLYISGGTGSSPAEQWIMNSDGSDLTQLTFDGNVKGGGDWSPDGTQIAYRQMDAGILNINILTLQGTAVDPTAFHTYTNPGTYTVTLTVTDDRGATDTDTCVITVLPPNQPPIADAGLNQTMETNVEVQFDASGSYDHDGYIVSYAWNFDDGTFGTGIYPVHSYIDDGVYTVLLTVTDDDGAIGMDTCIVPVLEPIPTPAILEIEKVKTNGPDVVETHTRYGWTLDITVTNLGGSDATDVIVHDVLPAELDLIDYTLTQGTLSYVQNGNDQMCSTSLTWNIGTMSPDGCATLTLVISTTTNPAGKQEFTSPGNYSLNDGAWVVGIDSLTGDELAAGPTPPIKVVAVDPEGGEEVESTEIETYDKEGDQFDLNEEINEVLILETENTPNGPIESETSALDNMMKKAHNQTNWSKTYILILLMSAIITIGAAIEARNNKRYNHEKKKKIEELDIKLLKGEISEETYLNEITKFNN